jgi:hypothetical protein
VSYKSVVLADSPSVLWMLNEASGATTAVASPSDDRSRSGARPSRVHPEMRTRWRTSSEPWGAGGRGPVEGEHERDSPRGHLSMVCEARSWRLAEPATVRCRQRVTPAGNADARGEARAVLSLGAHATRGDTLCPAHFRPEGRVVVWIQYLVAAH